MVMNSFYSHTYSHTHAYRHGNTHTLICLHVHTYTHTLSLTRSHTLTHTHTYTLTLTKHIINHPTCLPNSSLRVTINFSQLPSLLDHSASSDAFRCACSTESSNVVDTKSGSNSGLYFVINLLNLLNL